MAKRSKTRRLRKRGGGTAETRANLILSIKKLKELKNTRKTNRNTMINTEISKSEQLASLPNSYDNQIPNEGSLKEQMSNQKEKLEGIIKTISQMPVEAVPFSPDPWNMKRNANIRAWKQKRENARKSNLQNRGANNETRRWNFVVPTHK
ncbi:MAG: hypothetical protein EB127_12950 [Alphaproteobacteria bacterium]|nr:hypothetical protein [Alphaproteobacteria bacterium]